MSLGTLYIVATPIGNLEDVTLRALDTLKNVDLIMAEDTRVTKKLLSRYAVRKKMVRFEYKRPQQTATSIVVFLQEGKSLAIVSDAGTPNISDPGGQIVALVRQKMPDVQIVPVVGASALSAILSVCGRKTSPFTFLGFVPAKKGRVTFFKNLRGYDHTVIFYESSHRILKCLGQLAEVLGPEKKIIIGKELTKLHEKVFEDYPSVLLERFMDNPELAKGEFVVVV